MVLVFRTDSIESCGRIHHCVTVRGELDTGTLSGDIDYLCVLLVNLRSRARDRSRRPRATIDVKLAIC